MSGGPRRWREQRWLVDGTVRTQAVEFDQPRLGYSVAPVADDLSGADMAVIGNGVKKIADHVPVIRSVAERRERRARNAEDGGHPQSAAAHWYAAAQLWAMACWPMWEDGRRPTSSTRRRTPPTSRGAEVGDPWLERGFAVLAVDGPGQGEAAISGVHVSDTAFIGAGEALVAWLRARPEVDDRLVCTGTSFGSFWMTQIAATQPVFVKARHMWMAGLCRRRPGGGGGLTVDWLHDRVPGRPVQEENRPVTVPGQVVDLPHPRGSG